MPKIIATSGPLKGWEMPLTGEPFSLGRDPGSDCCLDDDFVSRRHCSIRLEDGAATVCDLESKNGTFVNNEPISKHRLEEGDRLKIGCSTFIYMEAEDAVAPIFTDSDHDKRRRLKTLGIDRTEPVYPNTDQLQTRALEMIFASIPAQRAAILLLGREDHHFVSGMYRQRENSSALPFAVSRKVTSAVGDGDLPVISNDGDSVLCVSIGVAGTKLGVIYADHPDEAALNEDHLRLLSTIADFAAAALGQTRYVEWLEGTRERLQKEVDANHEMVGDSPGMREVRYLISKAAPTEAPVLILGETGTGKELVARAIHRNSPRSAGPYMEVNCGAIAETLLESELFGSEKGAFTGAAAQRKGKVEAADGGTLFLDEVGELSLKAQATLLRFLQSHEFHRVGGTRLIKVNVRVMAATNRNLQQAMKEGRFREDLFQRLQVVPITMPRLAGRPEDIIPLANHFVKKHCGTRKIAGISLDAQGLLLGYDWPGNVRELENAIQRACIFATTEHIRPEDLPEAWPERMSLDDPKTGTYLRRVNAAKKSIVSASLITTGWDYDKAAKLLDMNRTQLYKLANTLMVHRD